MRKSHPHMFLFMAMLVVIGLVGQAWLGGEPGAVRASAVVGETNRLAPVQMAALPRPVRPIVASAPAVVAIAPARVERLSADAGVLVAAMCDLQLLADGTDLALDSAQWSALAAAVVRTQAIRHNYEAQIAVLQAAEPGRYRLEIPAYARAGDELRQRFVTELRAGLGEPVAGEVLAKLGRRLEDSFAGFGVGCQTLDITGDPVAAPGDVQIERTASYWNSVEGSDRVTTRREIHFPALEDPTGDSWSALLALVGEAAEARRSI